MMCSPPNKNSMVVGLTVVMFGLMQVAASAQWLPRVGRTISQNAAAYFGLNRQDVSFDSARVRTMTPLTIEHYIGGRVVESRVFTQQEHDAFLRYLREYETLMVTVPDPFIADSTLRPVLRYAQPIKLYRTDPSTIGVRTIQGNVTEGPLVAASPSVIAIARHGSVDSVSKGIAGKTSVEFVSILQIDSVWFDNNTTSARAVKGSAPTLADIFEYEEPTEMYDLVLPPELEEMMSMKKLGAIQQRRMKATTDRVPRVGIMVYGGTSLTAHASEVQTTNYVHQWRDEWSRTSTVSKMQESAYTFGATGRFYLSKAFDISATVSAVIQEPTTSATEPNTGFDAYSAQAVVSYIVLPRRQFAVPSIEVAVEGGVGASLMQYRMRGVVRTPTNDFVVSDDLSSVNITLSFGVAPALVLSDDLDLVLGLTYRSFLGGSFATEEIPYRVGNAGTVGWYQMEMASTTVSVLDLSLGLRFWL